MATTVDRGRVQDALFGQWDEIERLLRSMESGDWARPSLLPGWTVQDIAAHIIGTESMLDGLPAPEAPPEVIRAAHVHGSIGELNERWIHSMRGDTPERILQRWEELIPRRRRAVAAMSQKEFDAETTTPVGPESYGRFMRIRVFDCWMHEIDIRDAIARPGDEGGPRGDVAFAEIAGAVPRMIGKNAAAPEGARVRLELTGDLPRRIDVEVAAGRASVVEEPDFAPDVTVTMPSGVFVRLAGGRTSPETMSSGQRDQITVETATRPGIGGADARALGGRIPHSLAFTI